MFKKITIVLLMFAGVIICNAEEAKNLIPNQDFAKKFEGWYLRGKKAFSIKKFDDKNILTIKGLPETDEKNSYIKCSQTLKLSKDKLVDKEFTFGVTVKVDKLSGKLMFAVREIDAEGKSITYQSINMKKLDKSDWKIFTKTFTASAKTAKIAIYIVGSYLQVDDKIQVKDMFLHNVK